MIKIFQCVIILITVLTITACKKLVDIPDPIDTSTSYKIFSSDAQADQSIAGLYSTMFGTMEVGLTSGSATIIGGLASDEFIVANQVDYAQYDEVNRNNVQPENLVAFDEIWKYTFRIISIANAIMDGERESTSSTLTVKKREELKGHAKFVRAFCYLYLTGFYGKIPLPLSSKYNEMQGLTRSSTSAVMERVIIDLEESLTHFKNANLSLVKSKANVYAAEAILARAYLYTENWEKASLHASNVINSGRFSLETNLRDIFKDGSRESIFNFKKDPTNGQLVKLGDIELLSPLFPFFDLFIDPAEQDMMLDPMLYADLAPAFRPIIELNPAMLTAFENGDNRKEMFINYAPSPTVPPYNGQKYYYANKYRVIDQRIDFYGVVRLAEMYLIRAEANAHLNQFSLVEDDLETIRNRAGLTNSLNLTSKETALEAVAKERQTELFAEWAHRFFDLKRTGKALAVLGQIPLKAGLTNDKLVFPIPMYELVKNPKLGYD